VNTHAPLPSIQNQTNPFQALEVVAVVVLLLKILFSKKINSNPQTTPNQTNPFQALVVVVVVVLLLKTLFSKR
jgi:ElaB/YqjD/DUF883 family membrane-anchored ribosome-binding protein